MSSSDDEAPLAVPLQAPAVAQQDTTRLENAITLDDGVGGDVQAEELDKPATAAAPVPVTLISGYLGSGKTTLVNYILTAKHGYRCAVLLNEIADSADIERALVKEPEGQEAWPLAQWTELENGCICCSAKNDMVKALEALMQQRSRFDYVLIETTGLANPGPVAAALWTDEQLESSVCLDCIVTVVDARHITRQLSDPHPDGTVNEAQQQVAFADVVLLNKIDLASGEQLQQIEADMRAINAEAQIIRCHRCEIELSRILNTGIYSAAASARVALADTSSSSPPVQQQQQAQEQQEEQQEEQQQCSDPQCSHLDHHHHQHEHVEGSSSAATGGMQAAGGPHDSRVGTVTITLPGPPLCLARLRHWLDTLLWEETADAVDVFRIKGLLHVAGSERKHILQGVHELYDIVEGPEWQAGEQRSSKLVFIGRRLRRETLWRDLQACLEPA